MRDRDHMKISVYPKKVDKQWQDQVEKYIEKRGAKQLGPADNQNPSYDLNGSVIKTAKKRKQDD